ncbi:Cholesterol 7-desaturase [Blattella germanica]|nr:Cholesterol 7-desaturase [Blattella germanica]
MEINNSSSDMHHKAWWPGHILDQHLPPCLLNLADMVVTSHTYTSLTSTEAFVILLLLAVVYYYLILPMNYVRDLSEVGYGHLMDSALSLAQRKGKKKRDLVRDVRKMRKIGNLPPVYPNGWFMLLESDDLSPGQVKHVSALGENFAVFRTLAGAAHVLDAYCPHLGANMAVGGAVRGDCLECPFHGWRFKGENGKCTTEIPENGGDVAHLNAIHGPSLLAGGDLRFIERFLYSFARHVWSAQWQPHETNSYQATMHLHHEVRIFNKIPLIGMDVRAEQIGPAYVELYLNSTLGPVTILQTVTPVEPLLQKLVHRIYCPPLLYLYANFVLYGESVMVERDIMVWNHKKYIDKPLLVKEDHSIRRHRRWYSQFYSENSPQFSFQKESMDW